MLSIATERRPRPAPAIPSGRRKQRIAAREALPAAQAPARNHFDQYNATGDDAKPVETWLKEGVPATFNERFGGGG
jgi:hypothetical protein